MMIRLDSGSWNPYNLAFLLVVHAQHGMATTFVTDTDAVGRYVVGVTDERYSDVSDTAATVRRVASFIENYADTVDGFGVWTSDTGEVCIDAVMLVRGLGNARSVGRFFKQEEVYDSVSDMCFKVC